MYIDYINIHNYTYIDMTYIQIKTGAKAKTIMIMTINFFQLELSVCD